MYKYVIHYTSQVVHLPSKIRKESGLIVTTWQQALKEVSTDAQYRTSPYNKNTIQKMDETEGKIRYETYEEAMENVKKDGRRLAFVPNKIKDYDLCLTAVTDCGLALEYVPTEFKDKNMYMTALEENVYAIHFFPKEALNSPTENQRIYNLINSINPYFFGKGEQELYYCKEHKSNIWLREAKNDFLFKVELEKMEEELKQEKPENQRKEQSKKDDFFEEE